MTMTNLNFRQAPEYRCSTCGMAFEVNYNQDDLQYRVRHVDPKDAPVVTLSRDNVLGYQGQAAMIDYISRQLHLPPPVDVEETTLA